MDPVHHDHSHHEHEHSDVSVRGIVKFLIILAVSGLLIHFGLSGMWWYFNRTVAPPDAISPFAGPRQLPPQPRLQVTPRADLQTYLAAEQQRLDSYGTDPETGAIHIPVDRAIDLLAERGLPSRKQPPAGAAPSAVQAPPSGFMPQTPAGREPSTGPSPGVKPAPSPSPTIQGPRPERLGERSNPNAPRP